jgi:hypothetical protein
MKGCFGCFKLIQTIISTVILAVIAFIILFPCGGLEYIKSYVDSKMNPTKTELVKKAQEYGDFSTIPQDYELTKVISMFGANAVVAEHKNTNQKMALVNPGTLLKLSKTDVNANIVNTELKKLSSKLNNLPVKISNLKVGKIGTFKALDQDVPYIQVKMSLSGDTNRNFEGIIGVINNPDNKNQLIISGNDIGKYDQKTAEEYFKNIKLNVNSKTKVFGN